MLIHKLVQVDFFLLVMTYILEVVMYGNQQMTVIVGQQLTKVFRFNREYMLIQGVCTMMGQNYMLRLTQIVRLLNLMTTEQHGQILEVQVNGFSKLWRYTTVLYMVLCTPKIQFMYMGMERQEFQSL